MHRLLPAVLAASIPAAFAATPPVELLYGHFEVHVDYTPTPENPDAGWRFSVSYDRDDDFSTRDGVVRMDPGSTVFIAPPVTRTAVPSPAGAFSRFGPSGTPLWVLPQHLALGAPYLGVRTTMDPGIFQARVGSNYTPSGQGSISLRLVSAEGTGPLVGGHFATWKTESLGTTVFSFDTTNGIDAADEIPTIPVTSHTHYNWGFTRPGTYRLTFEAFGKLMAHGGAMTSGQATFTFAVPFPSEVGSGAELRVVAGESGPPRWAPADSAGGVAYAAERVLLEADTPVGDGWEMAAALSGLAAEIPNGVGVDPAAASAGLASGWSDLAFEVTEIRGPGTFALTADGTLLAEKASDSFAIETNAARDITAAFSATGLYRVTGFLRGMRNGVPVTGEPETLTFGAGLGADFDYAAWAASFERTAGWPAGALADPAGDADRDGVANGAEFALFWHGFDPTRPDAWRMPRASRTAEGWAVLDFLRDTWKDRLDESGWQIRPQTSADLVTWQLRSSRVPGFPLETAETGAGEGNAWGRVTGRRLRVMQPHPGRAFFRLRVDAP